MSGECERCGEHTVDCHCEEAQAEAIRHLHKILYEMVKAFCAMTMVKGISHHDYVKFTVHVLQKLAEEEEKC